MYNTQVEPERILEFSIQDGLPCYKVRWHDSWVPQDSLSHSWQHLIDHFWKTQSEASNQAKFPNRFLPNFATMLNLNTYANTHHPLATGHHPNTNGYLNPTNHHHSATNEANLSHYHHLSVPIHHQPEQSAHHNPSVLPHLTTNVHPNNMEDSSQNQPPILAPHLMVRPPHINTANQVQPPTLPDFNITGTNNEAFLDPDRLKTLKPGLNQRHVAKKLLNSAKTRVVRKVKQKNDDMAEIQSADGVTCGVCQRDFSRTSKPKKRLREHFRRMHLKNGKFKCSHCPKSFVCQQGLRDHEPVHSKERNYSCRYCSETFLRLSHLYVHLRTHEEERNFRCEACFQTFSVQSELKDHCTTTHADITADMTCGVCKQNLYSATSVYSHSLRHSGTRDHKCELCGAAFKRKQILDQHMKRHEQDIEERKTLECKICKKVFATKSSLRDHAFLVHQTSLEETDHKCDVCGKSFRNWANYRRHILLHTKISDEDATETARVQEEQIRKQYDEGDVRKHQLTCNVCQNVLDTVKSFLEHLQEHQQKVSLPSPVEVDETSREHVADNTLQDLSCSVCEKTFTKRKYLKSHMDIHSNIELKCDVCNMVFKRRDTLRIHRKRHVVRNENAQNYQGRVGEIYNNRKELRDKIGAPDKDGNISCPYCEKVFSKRKLLLAHIVLHGNVFYSCDICGKSYKQRSCLNKHEKSHKVISDEKSENSTPATPRNKAYKCDICRRTYAYKKRLIEHKKIHDNEFEGKSVEGGKIVKSLDEASGANQDAPHKCRVCNQRFRREESLSRHMKLQHTKKILKPDMSNAVMIKVRGLGTPEERNVIICDESGEAKQGDDNSDDDDEIDSEDENATYVCSTCSKEFSTIKSLHNHMSNHEALELPCSVCNRVYTRKDSLSRHMIQVHGIHKFKKKKGTTEGDDETDRRNVNDKVVEILKESMLSESKTDKTLRVVGNTDKEIEASVKSFHQNILGGGSSRSKDGNGGSTSNVIVVVVEKERKSKGLDKI